MKAFEFHVTNDKSKNTPPSLESTLSPGEYRTVLASQRTLLAFVRTALAVVSFVKNPFGIVLGTVILLVGFLQFQRGTELFLTRRSHAGVDLKLLLQRAKFDSLVIGVVLLAISAGTIINYSSTD